MWPGVVEIAGDAGSDSRGAEGGARNAAKGLLEEVGRGEALGEGDGLVAQLGLGVEEDGFVDEILAEEGSVKVGAALEQDAKDVALGEGGEDSGEA